MTLCASRQRGVALLTAMIVAFVAVAVGTRLGARQQVGIHRTDALLQANEAFAVLRDLEIAAAVRVLRDMRDNGKGYAEPVAIDPLMQRDGTTIAATLEDMQRRFNLNDLATDGGEAQEALRRFRRLLEALNLDPDLANAVMDWVDPDSQRRTPGGAEDDVYTRLDPPYRAANRAFARVGELRLVRGVTEEVFRVLAPHVNVLPAAAGLNINTADEFQLRALDEAMTGDLAAGIVKRREALPFESFAELRMMPSVRTLGLSPIGLVTETRYFLLRATIERQRRVYHLASLLTVGADGPQVLMRYPGED